jgi:hypothetical protein
LVGLAACSSKGLIFSTQKDPLPAEGGAPSTPKPDDGIFHGIPPRDGGECEPFRIDPMQSDPHRPPGLLLLVDVSQGMSEAVDMSTWWAQTASGIYDFLGMSSTGFSVGIEFFPNQTVTDACTFDYGTPDLDVSSLADTQAKWVITLMDRKLEGPSALAPALRGALGYMRLWSAKWHRPAAVAVLTRGGTTACPPAGQIDIAAGAADAISSDPKVTTYVIGLGAGQDVNQIAVSGGTKDPTMIMSDVRSGVALALGKIASDLNCTFVVQKPPKANISGVTINVLNTPTSAPSRNGPADCDPKLGGYYVSQGAETRITFCPASCAAFGLQYVLIDVNFACKPAGS